MVKVKFDIVRINGVRKQNTLEIFIKQNIEFIKESILYFMKEFDNIDDKISIVIIIPAKGVNIKIDIRSIKNNTIKKGLRLQFSKSIYKGNKDLILKNINNPIF